jgi:hypothetical protein
MIFVHLKHFVIGILIYTFAMMLIVNFNAAINPAPNYPTYPYSTRDMSPVIQTKEAAGSSAPLPADMSISNYDNNQSKALYDSYETARKENNRNTFIIVIALSFVYLILGVLVRNVGTVSVSLLGAGLTSILYTLAISFDELGKNAMSLVSGIAVIGLIALAYWKFGHDETQSVSEDKPTSL